MKIIYILGDGKKKKTKTNYSGKGSRKIFHLTKFRWLKVKSDRPRFIDDNATLNEMTETHVFGKHYQISQSNPDFWKTLSNPADQKQFTAKSCFFSKINDCSIYLATMTKDFPHITTHYTWKVLNK